MKDKKQQIKNLLYMLKIDVESCEEMYKDFESIMGMFDQLKTFQIDENTGFDRKAVTMSELREDKVIFQDFRKDLHGKYIRVPSVSKKIL